MSPLEGGLLVRLVKCHYPQATQIVAQSLIHPSSERLITRSVMATLRSVMATLHQSPFLSEEPFGCQDAYQSNQEKPGIQRCVTELPLRLDFDFRFVATIFDLAKQFGKLFGADDSPAGIF